MARLTEEKIKEILERDNTTFKKAPAEASTLDALAIYLFDREHGEAKEKLKKLIDAIGNTYNAAIEEGYIVGFNTALEIAGIEITDDQIESYLANK